MTRICLDCKVSIADAHFNRRRCMSCSAERLRLRGIQRSMQWAKDNPEKTVASRNARRPFHKAENLENYMLYQARRRAKVRGQKCTITTQDFSIPIICPVFKTSLSFEGHRDNTPSLDLIDITKGYMPGNVQVISLRANRCKSDLTLREMTLLANAFRRWTQ